ncbi:MULTISPECIES: hypothetical protein [unclassified Clostridium]|uniref:hypothetical protein n=1 Tax=unclassified Clostridium TaxID=2614128 RepID=UPI001106F659|nr:MULTISPECIES: hypothetical protein [unclassified Clostridium]
MQTVANDRADKIKELMLIYLDLPPEGQERFRRMVDRLVQTNTPIERERVLAGMREEMEVQDDD